MSNSRKFLIFSLITGLGVRLLLLSVVLSDTGVLTVNDQGTYIGLGAGLFEEKNFGAWFGAERLPLYPLFLSICQYFSFIPIINSTLPEQTLMIVVAVQNIIGLLNVFIMYQAGKLISKDMANLCAAFTILNLNMAMYCNQILTEALFSLLMVIVWYIIMLYVKKGKTSYIGLLAAILGLGTLIRPVTMYVPLFFIPLILLDMGHNIRKKTIHALVFVSLFFICLLPWLGRNYAIFGHAKLTTQGSAHIVGWVIPDIAQNEKGMNLEEARKEHSKKWEEYLASFPEKERKDIFFPQSKINGYLLDYLADVSIVSVVKAWLSGIAKNLLVPITLEMAYIFQMDWEHFYDTPGNSFIEQSWNFIFHNKNKVFSFMLIFGMISTLVFRLIQLCGMWHLFKINPRILVYGSILILYFLAVSGPVGYAKYRLPFEPVLVFFTAISFSAISFFRKTEQ